jgi:hypothetical protein
MVVFLLIIIAACLLFGAPLVWVMFRAGLVVAAQLIVFAAFGLFLLVAFLAAGG